MSKGILLSMSTLSTKLCLLHCVVVPLDCLFLVNAQQIPLRLEINLEQFVFRNILIDETKETGQFIDPDESSRDTEIVPIKPGQMVT